MNSNIRECFQMVIDHFEEEIESEKNKNNCDKQHRKVYTKEDFMLTKENEYSKICETLENNSHFPTRHSYNLLRRKCQIELEAGDHKDAAMTLLQTQAITFHHQAMQQYSKRILKANDKGKNPENLNPDPESLKPKSQNPKP